MKRRDLLGGGLALAGAAALPAGAPKAAQPRPLAALPSSRPSQKNSAAGGAIARAVAHVEIGFDGEKRKFTAVLATEGNVRRSTGRSRPTRTSR